MRALIAEDEPLLAQELKSLLAQAWPELEVAALAPNGLEALAAAERLFPEVAFLDIRMPGLDGLELAAELADRLGDRVPAIVFVTAHDEYALRAFERAAVDYLLKPVSAERLAQCVDRLKKRLEKPGNVDALVLQLKKLLVAETKGEPLNVIRAGSGNAVRMIPLEEVCYFQAADKYTNVVTREGEALIRTSLKELLAQLPAGRFQQIHRGTVVNMAEVAAALRDDAGRVSLSLRKRKETLPVSRL
ncbi:MAG TPA: LytTR family DNA-binding domain-containing protein, partial [Steroidobacteraceae bacterium]|nr:LytTR family DNA-binding domain-containing protein [Steroidobacteraceae bacterium]